MEGKDQEYEIHKLSHILMLVAYTFFSIVLIGEMGLLDWETWVIPLIIVGVITSWWMHISSALNAIIRLWVYAILMMAEFFFYGIHNSSMYDMTAVMAGIMMIYGMTGLSRLVTFAQITYFITYFYDIFMMLQTTDIWDGVSVTRSIVHPVIILIIGDIIRVVMHEWDNVTLNADEKIDDLKKATHRMDDFLVNVSHEIRTPVNAVIGLTSVLLERKSLNPEERKNLNAVNAAGYRIAEQIGDILDYTEIDMDKLMVTNETYMMSSILNDLMTDLTNTMHTELELIIDVDAKLPRALSGDALKIKKILRHLIINGLKFTKSGGVYVHIYPQFRPYGINLCIDVKDTGTGMEPDEIDHVFESFYQSDSGRSRSISGLGLGSSIVYGFVSEMGGFLTMESKKDQGTAVSVSIPQQVVDETGCMYITDTSSLCIASLLRYRAFDDPMIREFYNDMILHLAAGLNLPFYQAESMENLRDLTKKYNLTHVFIGAEEYMAEPSFYENIGRNTMVVVIADESFRPKANTKVRIIKKPFYCFPVINLLETNSKVHPEDVDNMRMTCPGLKVLVVDDEPMNLIVADGVFRRYGMEVTTANSGMDAIALCRDNNYDIIFMDHMMPEMDGIEAMHRIRNLKSHDRDKYDTLHVALTANVISSARNMFLAEGFDGFVAKPIDVIDLERVLKRLLPNSAIEYVRAEDLVIPEPEEEVPQETTEAAPETEDDILKDVGINIDEGMSYCQNDMSFYRTILLEYGAKAPEKMNEIGVFYAASDWSNYRIRVHALKSTSKMIGCKELFDKALALENAAKENDSAAIAAGHDDCMKKYKQVADAILFYLDRVKE